MEDSDKNSEKYLTNPDGSYILKKDGTPKRKPGRPKNSELSDIQLALQAKKKLDRKNQTVKELTLDPDSIHKTIEITGIEFLVKKTQKKHNVCS